MPTVCNVRPLTIHRSGDRTGPNDSRSLINTLSWAPGTWPRRCVSLACWGPLYCRRSTGPVSMRSPTVVLTPGEPHEHGVEYRERRQADGEVDPAEPVYLVADEGQ